MNTQNLWIDETNAAQWAESCHKEIAAWLSVIAGEQDGDASFAADLKIEVRPPTRKAAKRAFAFNTTLTGEIGFKWFDQEEVLTIPMPYHGVFLRRRDRARHPLTAVWPTWLAERQGFRIVTPTDLGKRTTSEWRIGLPGGHWMGATLTDYDNLSAHEKNRFQKTRVAYLGVFEGAPEWLNPALGLFGPRGDGKRSAEGPMSSAANWRSIHNLILKKAQAKELPEPTDEDDLDHRMLLTFPVWLKHRISKGLLAAVLPRGRNEDEDWRLRVQQVLAGWEKGDADLASQMRSALWSSLPTMGNKINWAINNYRSEDRADYIDPVNPLELVARITRVRRIHLPASKLQEMPAEFRQNHWSFEGRICPVESPESEQVGLTVHLASGAMVDFDGRLHHAHTEGGRLGYGAGLVPFFAHNDGARNMMGAKNMRQALPLRNAEPPVIRTGGENTVAAFAKPLVEAGLCPQAGKTYDDFCLGRDLLVAYLPWKGMNFEDAVVMGQQVVDLGLLDCIGFSKSLSRNLPVGWVPADPDDPKEVPGLVNGLVPSGTRISAGTPIACFKWEGKERTKQRVIRYQERTPVIVKRADFCRRSEWTGGKLECELELPIPIRPGDKLMGRHGNKGVVGTILPIDQMPCLPDDESLPEHLRGKPIDILLNPHGVISRMNLGQLLETHLGWLLKSGAFTSDDFHLHADDAHSPLASPFANVIDHEKVKESLESTGLDRYGRIQLVLPDGEKTIAPVVVGFQHILRLRHIPELKSQARRGGNEALYAARTGQAIHGKKFGGGQRLGEMEVWALAAHQADAVLGEMLGIKSSADMIAANAADSLSQGGSSHTGYSRVFKDWLFALGIDLAEDANDVSLRFLADGAVCERIDEKNEVTASGSLESRIAASFGCVMGKRKPCGFQLLDGEKIEFKGSKSSTDPTLTLGELLAHLGYKPSGKFVQDGDHYEVPLVDKSTGENSATLLLEFESVGDALKGVARFSIPAATARATSEQLSSLIDGMSQAEWDKPQPLPIVNLYGRFGNGSGKNWLANELIDQFLKEKPENWWKPAKQRNRCVTDMIVTCPHHRHIGIRGAKPFGEVFRSTPGGLFDPLIFGRYSRGFLSSNRWGYIKLPVAVKYPLHALLTSSLDPVDQARSEKRFISDLEKLGVPLCAIPEITHIPVLPTRYRLPAHSNGKLIRDEIERKGYAPLLAACLRYHEAAPEERAALAENIEMWVGSLFRRLAKSLGTKDGLIRRDGLGRRVDRSARLVVTPNPDLDWDKVGVPTAVLLELMGDSLEKWLIGRSPEEVEKTPLPTL